jgi:GDPmannose 4,6-dehydratase
LDYRDYVVSDPELYRPSEFNVLCGDAAKARKELGWSCRTCFEELVFEMVEADCQAQGVESAVRSANSSKVRVKRTVSAE